jgi:hypothetical protein
LLPSSVTDTLRFLSSFNTKVCPVLKNSKVCLQFLR